MAEAGAEYAGRAKLKDPEAEGLSAVEYEEGMYMGPNAAFNVAVNANDVKDYGDDNVTETDTSVVDATVSVEHNELTQEQEAYMLGHTIDETSKEMISNGDDVPPYLGIGFIGKSKRSGKNMFVGKFYPKCQFREPGDDNATKHDSTTFSHTTIEGNIFRLKNSDWRVTKEFNTLAEAKTWLNGKAGITAQSGSQSGSQPG